MTHHPGHLGQVCSSVPAHSMAGLFSLSPTLGIQSTGNSFSMILAGIVLALEHGALGLPHRWYSVTVSHCYPGWKGDVLHALWARPGWPFLGEPERI